MASTVEAERWDGVENNDPDIYRGSSRTPIFNRPASPDDNTSSSSFRGRGRLGTIAAVVETAITRWARGNASSASSSSSSLSSCASTTTLSRSQYTRHRRRTSVTRTILTVQSERDITARISRIKAREESRQTPREFALYLPEYGIKNGATADRVIRTMSLSLVLPHLDAALKKTTKIHRTQPGSGYNHAVEGIHHRMPPGQKATSVRNTSPSVIPHRGKKGKVRERSLQLAANGDPSSSATRKAWFLDVASPTWEDMGVIGKLLHLHPLTLEDILQRDPREKLECFPRLGYYFVSFRAIESQNTRDRRRTMEDNDTLENSDQDEGIGEANVYLIVFHEGICSFHFTDISEHTDRVRNRMELLEEVVGVSSDWIAHGILDSIVDSFFPFLEEIEKEVVAIDDLVFAGTPTQVLLGQDTAHDMSSGKQSENSPLMPTEKWIPVPLELNEKHGAEPFEPQTTQGSPRSFTSLLTQLFRRTLFGSWVLSASASDHRSSTTHTTLWRMARTRRLVTSLARLLAAKLEVVAQIRKRLLTSGESGMGSGTGKYGDDEVAIYLGDVQDHILTLQHSLAHYERMLSQSHPTYLSQLRTAVALTKSGTDKAIIYLTVVSVAVLCVQTLIGTFSLNIKVPSNNRADGPYNVFGIVIALASLILCGYLSVVRYWWIQAKRRRRAVF